MPNSIELPKGYENVLMEAYRKESLTAVLESAGAAGQHRADGAAGRVLLPRLLHGRLGDVQANGDCPRTAARP